MVSFGRFKGGLYLLSLGDTSEGTSAMKPKLKRKLLVRAVRDCLQTTVSDAETQGFPWVLLHASVKDFDDVLPQHLKDCLYETLKNRDVLRYVELQTENDPQLYRSPLQYFAATSVLSLLKKYPFNGVTGLDPKAEAIRTFRKAEQRCARTNKRLQWYRKRGFRLDKKQPGMHGVIHSARLKIASWLGSVDLNQIYSHSRHGPGGAVQVGGNKTTAYYKFAAGSYTCSSSALALGSTAILADEQWRRHVVNGGTVGDVAPLVADSYEAVAKRLRVTDYNKVSFVPKTVKTLRSIAVEPLLNVYLQLGVGAHFRRCLKRVGCDLNDQTRNQTLARLGSLFSEDTYRRLCTIDLSSASDTVSYELVKELLPEDWFDLLNSLRSRYGLLEGETVLWHKFSSMGNGFTFELESLIFLALAHSVSDELRQEKNDISVYGDDLIVPMSMALRFIEVLRYCGFSLNVEKSYIHGPFRESCGADWFDGEDTRPFFLKREIKTRHDYLHVLNSVRKQNEFVEFNERWQAIFARLPSLIRLNLRGPCNEDLEGHIHCPLDFGMSSPLVEWDRGMQQWSYVSAIASAVKYPADSSSALALQVFSGMRLGREEFLRERTSFTFKGLSPNWLDSENGQLGRGATSSAVVTRRKSTRLKLRALPSNGWDRT